MLYVINDLQLVINFLINLFSRFIDVWKSVSFTVAGATVSYWQILCGFALLGFVIFAFWKGAQKQ